jgi:predicted nucleic acid-binding protein
MSATVVIDASAFLRAAGGHAEALSWFEEIEGRAVSARAPDLLYAEIANAVLTRVRQGGVELEDAHAMIDIATRLPVRVTSLRDLAPSALKVAKERGLSAYDACYLVLAEQTRATFLTADRAAAAAAADSILLV